MMYIMLWVQNNNVFYILTFSIDQDVNAILEREC